MNNNKKIREFMSELEKLFNKYDATMTIDTCEDGEYEVDFKAGEKIFFVYTKEKLTAKDFKIEEE